jgi:hypothetical protein
MRRLEEEILADLGEPEKRRFQRGELVGWLSGVLAQMRSR